MPILTPDIEGDFVGLLVSVLPTLYSITGDARNVWEGPPRFPDGNTKLAVTFVRKGPGSGERHSDGQVRTVNVRVLHRFDETDGAYEAAYRAARTLADSTYDGIHGTDRWTGASGYEYTHAFALDQPTVVQGRYWVNNFEVGLSS